jgi:hypothetical protein
MVTILSEQHTPIIVDRYSKVTIFALNRKKNERLSYGGHLVFPLTYWLLKDCLGYLNFCFIFF